jgi:murein tripeptide amidase MpaA
MLIVTNFSSDP